MKPIKEILNKIKWDKKYNSDDFIIYYFDRIKKDFHELKFKDIIKIEENFLEIKTNNGIINLPLHRIRQVNFKGDVFWKR
jgi:uncharacterized protein (UPF0248 family)